MSSKRRWNGNLIHTIDGGNPTALLLDVLRSKGLTDAMMKEDEVYVGVGSNSQDGEFTVRQSKHMITDRVADNSLGR